MGSQAFYTTSKGKTAQDAFDEARRRARYDASVDGGDGYTGTIEEKISFVIIDVNREELGFYDLSDQEYAEGLIKNDDPRIKDTWGPAGCIQVDEKTWLFFGWSSC